MKIVFNNLSLKRHELLVQGINNLKSMIRVDYRAEINIIDSLDKLIYWATISSLDKHKEKKTVIVATPKIITVLNATLKKDSLIIIDISKPPEDIVIDIAKFLSCNVENNSTEEKLFISEKEAETIFSLYVECNYGLTKLQQNIKYRLMRKLSLTSCLQLFVWWKLTDMFPRKMLKTEVLIKK